MREVLKQLGIEANQVLGAVLQRAWEVHLARGGGELVSRATLLYAALTTDVVVRAVLDGSGLRIRELEKALGFAATPQFSPTTDEPPFDVRDTTLSALREYSRRWPKRPLDGTGLAVVILMTPSARVHQVLREARVDIGRAVARLGELAYASPEAPWIQSDVLDYATSERLGMFLEQNRQRFGVLTSSGLIISAADANYAEPYTAIGFLRDYIRGRVPASAFDRTVKEWLGPAEGAESFPLATMPFAAIFEHAYAIARRASVRSQIGARHFVGAMIAQAQFDAPTGLRLFLLSLSIQPRELATEFLNYLDRHAPAQRPDKMTAWREILGVRDDGFLPTFHAEALDGADLLDVTGDVEAFATLMASKKLAPPLSIGLFGDWGSGKSFFMKRVRAAVAERAARGSDDFYDRIVQIEFNAWHYVEANLWASLVEHIFRNLRLTTEPPGTSEEDRRKHLLQELDAEIAKKNAAELAVKQAEEARDRAAQELDAKKKAADATAATLPNMRAKDVWEMVRIDDGAREELQKLLAQLGVPALLTTKDDVRKTLEDLRRVGSRGRLLLAWTVQQPRVLVLLAVLLVLVPLAVLPLVALLKEWIPTLSTAVVQLTAIAGSVTAWIARRVQSAQPLFRRLDAAREQIDRAVEAAESQRRANLVVAEAEVTRAKNEVVAAKNVLETAETAVAEKKKQLDDLTAGRQLARFIDDRSASDDYRKLLGVLATVRNDFEKLSTLLDRSVAERSEEAMEAKKKFGIDRIILYIDDLDRCHPDRVVEVLQAVHLLLAFKLFVVVVGVDARWVSESLRQKHRALWRGKGADGEDAVIPGYAVQPHDYLEKIFQVPFWLEPMQPATTATYIRNLLIDDIASGSGQIRQRQEPGNEERSAGSGSGSGTGAASSGGAIEPKDETDDTPKQLELQEKEVQYMESDPIAELVGRSPRTAKRFVNTYRFFRAGVPTRRIEAFLGDEGVPEYRRVLLLLAIVVGAPDVSVEVFAAIRTADADLELSALAAQLRNKGNGHRREWERSAAALESLDALCWHLVDLLPKVARYSFRPPFAEVPPTPPQFTGPMLPVAKQKATPKKKGGPKAASTAPVEP